MRSFPASTTLRKIISSVYFPFGFFFSTHLAIKQMQIEEKKAFSTLLFHFWLFNSAFYGYLRAIEAATTNDANQKKFKNAHKIV